MKNIGDFDYYLNDNKLKNIESNMKSISAQVSVCNKQIQSLKTISGCIANEKNMTVIDLNSVQTQGATENLNYIK